MQLKDDEVDLQPRKKNDGEADHEIVSVLVAVEVVTEVKLKEIKSRNLLHLPHQLRTMMECRPRVVIQNMMNII